MAKRVLTDREIHFETLIALGAKQEILTLSPTLTLGSYYLLYLTDNPLTTGLPPTKQDVINALVILTNGKALLTTVFNKFADKEPLLLSNEDVTEENYKEIYIELADLIAVSSGGYDTILSNPEGQSLGDDNPIIDYAWIAQQAGLIRAYTGLDIEEIIWRLPMAAAGHFMALHALVNGAKVSRKLDVSDDMQAVLERYKNQINKEGQEERGCPN